jgi:hypothetical protein
MLLSVAITISAVVYLINIVTSIFKKGIPCSTLMLMFKMLIFYTLM